MTWLRVALTALMIILLTPISLGNAITTPYTTQAFTLVGPPSRLPICTLVCIEANYRNNLDSITLGVVYIVYHNALGQTVLFSTATITPQGGQNVTAYFPISGLPTGSYNASIFAVSQYGIPLSVTSTISFAI